MLNKKPAAKMGHGNLSWLKTHYHFSFADYYNPENMSFGALRVINDDIVDPGHGFDTHPHHDMEIITYVISGELTHKDSLGNESTIGRGAVQYMSAGTGVLHSEYNNGDQPLRLLQIWVMPDAKGHTPRYGDHKYKWKLHANKWHQIASSRTGEAEIRINQDVNINLLTLDSGNSEQFAIDSDRQADLVKIEGSSEVNGVTLDERDGLEIIGEDIEITSKSTSHYLIIEMAQA